MPPDLEVAVTDPSQPESTVNEDEDRAKAVEIDGRGLPWKEKNDNVAASDEAGIQVTAWDGVEDPANPINWSSRKKWTNVAIISCQATLSPIASSILAVATIEIGRDFGLSDPYTPTLPVAIFVLGTGIGPLYLAPCSELYGRRVVYMVCFTLFTIFNIGCALAPKITALAILRFLSGMAGSAGPGLGGSTIGDMFQRKDRGRAQALYSFGPTAGPVIGGVIGGFMINGTGGWRWLIWIMVIAPGVTVVLSFFLLNETYAPVLLYRKARKRGGAAGRLVYHQSNIGAQTSARYFVVSITRPLRMLIFSPICTVMSLYMSLIYGILYLHLVTIPLLFGPIPIYSLFTYGWQNGTTGLAYLGAGLGIIFGILICALFLNRSYAYMIARHGDDFSGNVARPELRLPFLQLGMSIVPIGLIIYGWSAQKQLPWPIPLLGAAVFATGMLMAYVCIQTYIVDVFEHFAASALAATIVARAMFSCVFALIGVKLYKSLGYAWGTMLLAFICIATMPAAWVLYIYGPKLRKKKFSF